LLYFTNGGDKQKQWLASLHLSPIRLSVRLMIKLPYPVRTVQTAPVNEVTDDGIRNVVIMITKENMELINSSDVCNMIHHITKDYF
jgi:hypothetical protein